jgi:imidazolonepropionase-like amidohydrolase
VLVLRTTRLFDGVDLPAGPRLVFVADGRIVGVEPAGDAPSDAELVDLGDVTLLPGLIDAHVHLGFDASLAPVAQMLTDDDASLLLRMRLNARRALVAGITTVRDLGDRNYLALRLRDWFASGAEPGPHLVAAGPPITITGGHCHFMGGEVDGEVEVRRAVRMHVKQGVDVVKIMATGGNLTPGTNPGQAQFTVAELRAAVDEAHRLGRGLTAHAHGLPGIAAAAEAGVDCIEHCSFRGGGERTPDAAVIDQLAARDIAVSPTVGALPSTAAPDSPAARLAVSFRPILAEMHRRGIRLIASTDAGISPARPHDGLPGAVDYLATDIMRPVDALRSATSVSAQACGLGGRKGVIRTGADADLLAVAGDPTRDPTALRAVRAVYRAGQRVV